MYACMFENNPADIGTWCYLNWTLIQPKITGCNGCYRYSKGEGSYISPYISGFLHHVHFSFL